METLKNGSAITNKSCPPTPPKPKHTKGSTIVKIIKNIIN